MASFNINIDEVIIDFVRDNHCLYDKCDKNFKNVAMRKDLWKKISETLKNVYEINMSAEAIEKRWSSLRDMFTRENRRQKLPPSGSGYEPTKEWELYRHMLFLTPHIAHRRTKTSFIQQSQSQNSLLETNNTSSTSSLSKKQSSDFLSSQTLYDHNYNQELFESIEGQPLPNVETEGTIKGIESEILNRPASTLSSCSSITTSSILSSEPSTISNQNNFKRSLTLQSLNKITPEIDEFAKRRKNKDDKIDRDIAEASKEISETMKVLSSRINNQNQKDDYMSAIENGFKYIPPRNKTQCLIEVLQIIQKYEERQ